MSLGAFTIVEKTAAQGPVFHIRGNLVGDNAYPAGGSTGLLALVRAAMQAPGLNIMSVEDQSAPSTVSKLEYDHTNDKLFARVRATGAESAVSNQSAVTYNLKIEAY